MKRIVTCVLLLMVLGCTSGPSGGDGGSRQGGGSRDEGGDGGDGADGGGAGSGHGSTGDGGDIGHVTPDGGAAGAASGHGASDGGLDGGGGAGHVGLDDPFHPAIGEWPMFKREAMHAGTALDMTGDITADTVCERWSRKLSGENRGSSGPLIVRIDGEPRVVVASEGTCEVGGGCTGDAPGTIWMLRGDTGEVVWSLRMPDGAQADPYGPVAMDVDRDGKRELVVPSLEDNRLFLIRLEDEPEGDAGSIQWTFTYDQDGRSETGPIAVQMDGDEPLEIVFGTDFGPAPGIFYMVDGATGDEEGRLPVRRRSEVNPECDVVAGSGASKADSSSAAAARIDGETRVFGGAWDGRLYSLAYRDGELVVAGTDELPEDTIASCPVRKIRNGPVVAPIGRGGALAVAFGHMAEREGTDEFLSAELRLIDAASMDLLAELDEDIWKSSLSIGPLMRPTSDEPYLTSGRYKGFFAARAPGDGTLSETWNVELGDGSPYGANRSSPALADIDDDGAFEVIVGVEGADGPGLVVLAGATGAVELRFPSAGIAGAPALGDVDDDGRLEIVTFDTAGTLHVLDSECP